jgi:hypothetical protein
MKRNFIAAVIASLFAASAFAGNGNDNGNNGVSGSASVGGQYTVGTVSASIGANSVTSGNAVSATKTFGPNAFSTQSTVSTGNGSATAGINVTPTSVNANTSQNASTNVVSKSDQSAQLPTLDNAGLLINGTAGVSQVTNNAAAGVTQTIVGQTGQASIDGSIAVQGIHGF